MILSILRAIASPVAVILLGIGVMTTAAVTQVTVEPLPTPQIIYATPSPDPSSVPSPGLSPDPSPSPAPSSAPVSTPSVLIPTPPTSPTVQARSVACGNSVDNSGGLGLICEITVANALATATVTVRECHGAAGAPSAACTVDVMTVTGNVTHISQCNGSANGGGATMRCSVSVTGGGGSSLTVNQCVGSGDGLTAGCAPLATASGADIVQCNGSANGGTLVGLLCTASGPGQGVTVDQCNGSGNGGGGLVVCSTTMRTR